MRLTRLLVTTVTIFLAAAAFVLVPGTPPAGASQNEKPEDVAARTGHHSHKLCDKAGKDQAACHAKVIDRGSADPTPLTGSAPYGASPAMIKSAYGFPTAVTAGAGSTVALIEAYDSPTAQADLNLFSNTYSLPCNACLTKVNQNGGTSYPAFNASWALENSLDVQWVHAIAPGANILLVEANTNNWSDLMAAVDYARTRAQYISMSFGGPEWSSQTYYDTHFSGTSVSYFASSGDAGLPPEYPSASPNVVSVGGTTLNNLGTSTVTESAWASGGGGCSAYESATAAQKAFSQYGQVGCKRGARATPDVSLDANPMSGVSVYSGSPSSSAGWYMVGGTSASAPMWAARAAVAGGVMNSARIYGATPPPMRDITSGSNGAPTLVGYDLATGRGSWFDGTAPPPPPPPPPPSGSGINNGGLETGNLTGWTPRGTTTVTGAGAHSGTYSAEGGSTAPTSGDSSIVQNFTVPANATTLSFWYKQTCPDGVSFDWATATLTNTATGATTTVLPHTCTTNAWTQVTAPVTSGSSYTVTLTSHDDNVSGDATYTLFDDIAVS